MDEEILAFAKAVGQVEAGEEDVLSRLCQTARMELEGRLRADVSPEDCRGAFVIGAAWLALAGLCAGRQSDGFSAWSVGEVQVSRSGDAGEQGAVYRAQAERLMAPYCVDGGFAFLGVRG